MKSVAAHTLNTFYIFLVYLLISTASPEFVKAEPGNNSIGNAISIGSDLYILRERVINELLRPAVNGDRINTMVDLIREDGSWPDIDYEDVSHTGFEHSRHLDNMLKLSRAYKKQESIFYGDPQLKQVIVSALDFWLKHDFICDNWWWNQIGTPERLVNILLIIDDELTEVQRTGAAPIIGRASLDAWGARPGGDLIKIASILGKYGLFTRDAGIVEQVVETISGEIMFAHDRGMPSDERGLQPDLSFHHRHDRVTSTLSYGLGYARAFADWAAKVAGTTFSFPDEALKLLVDFYLDGICKTMAYGRYADPGAKNRSITRKGTLNPKSSEIPEKLLQATSYRKKELEEIVKIRKGEQRPDLTSNKFFWRSEYFSHQRPDYFTSVRMYSSRNHSMEVPYNGEGVKNHHFADGSNFISRTGEEYRDVFPVWDWQKIPGTTVVQKPALPAEDEIQQKGLTSFVGAVSDGRYGAAAFDFKSPLDSLEARKAWFMFDKEYVSLGSGIQSDAEYPVATTLNQCLLRKDVVVRKDSNTSVLNKGEHNLNNVDWLYHDGIAYLFPLPTDVYIYNKPAFGNWRSINRQPGNTSEEVSEEIFKAWLDHGSKPQNAAYEYIVVPEIDASEIPDYRKKSHIEILANSPKVQAVRHRGLNISQIVFYEAGKIRISRDITLAVDSPGLVMIDSGRQLTRRITVADPSRQLTTIHLKVTALVEDSSSNFKAVWNEEGGYSDIYIDLPQDEYTGKSVIIEV